MPSDTLLSLKKCLLEAQQQGLLRGQLKIDEPLNNYTTWRIGGPAECLYRPEDKADVQAVLKCIPRSTTVNWLGLGSNLLVRDKGLKGLLIYTHNALKEFNINMSEQHLTAEVSTQSGVPCAIFSRKCAASGLNGAEFLSGIPGTMGGALAMNAGAFGGETWRHVSKLTMINHSGQLIERYPDEFEVNYRSVQLKQDKKRLGKQEWFLGASFSFTRDEQKVLETKAEIKLLLEKRAASQPTKQANAGSVFKNPDNDFAARLIESCGLKGKTINGAQVSQKHANFIINTGNAKASDVEALIKEIQSTVWHRHNIRLQTEVCIIGDG